MDILPRVPRALACAGVLTLVLATTGCLELRAKLAIDETGKGTQTLELGLSKQLLTTLRQAAPAIGSVGPRFDPSAIYRREAVAAELERSGVALLGHETWTRGSRDFVRVEAGFDRFDELRKSSLFGGRSEVFFLEGRNPGNVRIVFYPQGKQAWAEAREAARRLRLQPDRIQREFFEQRREKIAGLDVELRIELPGNIDFCSTNMHKDGGRTAVARIRALDVKDAADLVTLLAPRYEVEIDGREVTWKLDAREPDVKLEPSVAPASASGEARRR